MTGACQLETELARVRGLRAAVVEIKERRVRLPPPLVDAERLFFAGGIEVHARRGPRRPGSPSGKFWLMSWIAIVSPRSAVEESAHQRARASLS